MRGRTPHQWILGVAVFAFATLLLVPAVSAQNPSGSLTGTVTDPDGAGLPGVTVTVSSPNLQGERVTQSGVNGGYKLGVLPAGVYSVIYELEGFASVSREVKVSAAQTQTSNVSMQLATVAETIVVTSAQGDIAATGTLATTFTKEDVEKLPVQRTILSTVNLAPGVHDTGPAAAPSINGAMTFENLFMINGVQIQDNIRGTPLPLFIEDAVQESTVSTASVSAEYGRFTGGVVNILTKSGGNEFSGSFRENYTNDDWVSETSLSDPRIDDINHEEEATLGGYFWKDHIWFFGAGRQREEASTGQLNTTLVTYPTTDNEDRLEGKLTLAANPSHSVIGSYLEIERERANSSFTREMDLQSLTQRTDPQELSSVNYTGILTSSLFVEAQYSEREYQIGVGSGGPAPDGTRAGLIAGTMMRHRPTARRWHSPTFCGDCPEQEIRNNEDLIGKGSYFLTTESIGTHDITFGYDQFSDIRFSVNHQTGSDFQVWAEDAYIVDANNIFPVFEGSRTWLVWWPPVGLDIARPTDFETNSFYVNDSWQLNDKWSFNVGMRYDENDGRDSSGSLVAKDDKISPRLGLSYDVHGDGDLVINASLGTYVAAIASGGNVGDGASTGGALAGFGFFYGGPPVNTDPGCVAAGTCLTTEEALNVLYDWYFNNGGTDDILNGDLSNLPGLIFGCIPGATQVVRSTFKSPSADELTVGVTKRLGNQGLVRADVIYREWEDFYADRNRPGDTVDTDAGTLDVTEIGNFGDSNLERTYMGINLQGRYRFTDRLLVAGNYTWSELEGNIIGEFSNSGPVSQNPGEYREYKEPRWNAPVGRLEADQTHKLRVWAIYDIVDTAHHHLNVSLLQNYFSGSPYDVAGAVDSRPYVTNPGYASPPSEVDYYFFARDRFTKDSVSRTDLSLNYSFNWNLFGKTFEVFLQPEMINVFDEDAIIDPGQDILHAENSSAFETFNPFTETPVEGVHYGFEDDFGDPRNENDFQTPRTFRFSVGFRF